MSFDHDRKGKKSAADEAEFWVLSFSAVMLLLALFNAAAHHEQASQQPTVQADSQYMRTGIKPPT